MNTQKKNNNKGVSYEKATVFKRQRWKYCLR